MYDTMYVNKMPVMLRKQVYLESQQDRLLKRLSIKRGQTESELIRMALDLQMKNLPLNGRTPDLWKQERSYINSRMKRASLRGGRTWRRRDLH